MYRCNFGLLVDRLLFFYKHCFDLIDKMSPKIQEKCEEDRSPQRHNFKVPAFIRQPVGQFAVGSDEDYAHIFL